MSERSLASELGISAQPVREAQRRLEHEGMVVTLPRSGTVVAEVWPVQFGVVLFVAWAVGKISMWEATKTSLPFYLAGVAVLLLVTYVPARSLWLPRMFH